MTTSYADVSMRTPEAILRATLNENAAELEPTEPFGSEFRETGFSDTQSLRRALSGTLFCEALGAPGGMRDAET